MFFTVSWSELFLHMGEHLLLVAIAMLGALVIGLPLGILITRQPQWSGLILGVANAVQTIPSLAIFGFLISVPLLGGIGKMPAIVALLLYALLPLIRNTYVGITTVDPAIREAGRGMGMTEAQLLLQVEIPLALATILAGVRVATVISVGVATIAAAIGGGGLGVFIFRGIATVNNQLILAGAIPAALMALGADFGLGLLEQHLRQPRRAPEAAPGSNPLRLAGLFGRRQAVGLGLAAAVGVGAIAWSQRSRPATITLGGKNFTEQVILGEILAQHIEATTRLKVDRRFNLGGTFICHEAVKSGQIAGYVEYTGTALTAILKRSPQANPAQVYAQVKQDYAQKYQVAVLSPLGFENTFAMIIRGEDAQRLNLKTLSQATPYAKDWTAGFGYEFVERADGYPGLSKTYGLSFGKIQQMELGLMYQALKEKKVDLIAASSTDGLIPALNLVILEDDKHYFPPYEAVPVFNQAILRQYPELEAAIAQLANRISTTEMQAMNYQVDQKGRIASLWPVNGYLAKLIPR